MKITLTKEERLAFRELVDCLGVNPDIIFPPRNDALLNKVVITTYSTTVSSPLEDTLELETEYVKDVVDLVISAIWGLKGIPWFLALKKLLGFQVFGHLIKAWKHLVKAFEILAPEFDKRFEKFAAIPEVKIFGEDMDMYIEDFAKKWGTDNSA